MKRAQGSACSALPEHRRILHVVANHDSAEARVAISDRLDTIVAYLEELQATSN